MINFRALVILHNTILCKGKHLKKSHREYVDSFVFNENNEFQYMLKKIAFYNKDGKLVLIQIKVELDKITVREFNKLHRIVYGDAFKKSSIY